MEIKLDNKNQNVPSQKMRVQQELVDPIEAFRNYYKKLYSSECSLNLDIYTDTIFL